VSASGNDTRRAIGVAARAKLGINGNETNVRAPEEIALKSLTALARDACFHCGRRCRQTPASIKYQYYEHKRRT